jgi:hypothetical protein
MTAHFGVRVSQEANEVLRGARSTDSADCFNGPFADNGYRVRFDHLT